MTEPAARLKSCVRCGGILQASDASCPACRAAQPEPGEQRAAHQAGTGAPAVSWARRLVAALLLVGLLAAVGWGLNVLRQRLAARAAAGGASSTDAAHLELQAHEAGGDAFDRAARDGVPTVTVDLERVLEYYTVEGTTTQQIFEAIDRRGPDGPDGKAVGLTRMQGGAYNYARDERSGRCVVTSLGATLTITLPRLTTTPLPEPIYERWQSYVAAVGAHEQRHADIYTDAAGRVAERLRSMQPFADRSAMEQGFRSAWTAEMDVAERDNRDFHRREAQDVAFEREIVGNGIQRVEHELKVVAERVEAQERRFPDLKLPPDEYRQHEADRVRYDDLLAERAGLIEQALWLH